MNNLDMLIAEKERLESQLDFTEQKLKDRLKEEKERFQKQLDVVEQKIKDWKNSEIPNVGTLFYCLKGDGSIAPNEWRWLNWGYWKQGNAFLTYVEASAESKRRAIHQEIKAYANECNGETKVNWSKSNQAKFFIIVDMLYKIIHIRYANFTKYPNQVCFLNENDAKKCVELIGKDRLLKDYFQVTI